jgi:hypothetical protein
MRSSRAARLALTFALVVFAAAAATAQRGGGFYAQRGFTVPYNGKFTFTRIRYNSGGGGFGRGGGGNAWNHDYPRADLHLPMILKAITKLDPNIDETNVLDLEDPEIFKNPILYMWEPGYWQITDEGARNLRDYMLKGGFVVFDDFEMDHWYNFEHQFRRALPDAKFIKLDASHRIFNTFFEIKELNLPHPNPWVPAPGFYGVFENNDPNGRMMAFACHNSDIAEYWEYSGTGYFPVDTTNDAYKIGINFAIYAMTH